MQHLWHCPDALKPDRTQEQVTKATADTFIQVANSIQQWADKHASVDHPERLSHFIIRLLFSLFVQDMGLLPNSLVTSMVNTYKRGTTEELSDFTDSLRRLYAAMRDGGFFGVHRISHFNGGLFDDDFVPELPTDIIYSLNQACQQNWASIDPFIFGTLFERIIDKTKRSQLGLHYTSKRDIMLVAEPVIMEPLRNQWALLKQQVRVHLYDNNFEQAHSLLKQFSDQLAKVRVLDPACGSGNFLYVSLQQLLDLQKEVITFAKVLKKAGLPHIRFHDLRHSHATLLLKAGIHAKIVSERLGHANIGITLDTYSHVLPGLQERAAERFDEMLEPGVIAEDVSKMLANETD